jgi:hypothetical protein
MFGIGSMGLDSEDMDYKMDADVGFTPSRLIPIKLQQ